MTVRQRHIDSPAGQTTWTRDLARDLFPLPVTPFHWTLLQRPIQAAMHGAWADLGVKLPDRPLWHRGDDGLITLNADAMAHGAQALHGAAWIAAAPEPTATGLLGRLRAQGTIDRVQQRVDAVAEEIRDLNRRLADWQTRVRGLRWAQADLLQVMEELEPQAQTIFRSYFILRAGLSAATADVSARLRGWLPDHIAAALSPYAGLEGLPSVELAYALHRLGDTPGGADMRAFLAAYGHRGPGEAMPDARRWYDQPELAARVARLPAARNAEGARAMRQTAEAHLLEPLQGKQRYQTDALLARARNLCRAVDQAWDGLVRVMATAQIWLHAVATEALSAGLIAASDEVHFLELEELKQVATGEWHEGHSTEVRAEVMRRCAAWLAIPAEPPQPPCAACPGTASGPAYRLSAQDTLPNMSLPTPGSVLLCAAADPGAAPYWLSAAALVDGSGDAWSQGMLVARALAIPAVAGMSAEIAAMPAGQALAVDGESGRVTRIVV